MPYLLTPDQIKALHDAEHIPAVCDHCNSHFLRQKKNCNIRKNLKATYCSFTCSSKREPVHKGKKEKWTQLNCCYCNKPFQRENWRVRRRKKEGFTLIFCGKKCQLNYSHDFIKPTKTSCGGRSKLERELEITLKKEYPNIEIMFNNRTVLDGYELDIYVPSIKLAFELNGPFHYYPIKGKDTLTKAQIRDAERIKRCEENKISLCVINVCTLKGAHKSQFNQVLNIVKTNINVELNKLADAVDNQED